MLKSKEEITSWNSIKANAEKYFNGFIRANLKVNDLHESDSCLEFYVQAVPYDIKSACVFLNRVRTRIHQRRYNNSDFESSELKIICEKSFAHGVRFEDYKTFKHGFDDWETFESLSVEECHEKIKELQDNIVKYFLDIIGESPIYSTSSEFIFITNDKVFTLSKNIDSKFIFIDFSKIVKGRYKAMDSGTAKVRISKVEISKEIFAGYLRDFTKDMFNLDLKQNNESCVNWEKDFYKKINS